MRAALRGSQARAVPQAPSRFLRTAGVATLTGASMPAPIKGWDAATALADMDPASAIILDNWFPEPSYLRLRAGHTSHATGVGSGAVESLMAYHPVSGSSKLFAAGGANVYDVTAAGAVGAAAVASTGNSRFQHVNFTTAGGHFLFIVNGSTAATYYDGATWTVPVITGISSSDIIHVNAHQHRLWFTLVNSTRASYLPIDSIAGAVSNYEFGAFFTDGGYLMATATWTLDAGNGPDDYLVAISSRGQVVVFAGTDPSSTSTWSLRGVYKIGAPIGRRCFCKVGGDLAVVTTDGVVSLGQSIVLDRAITRKVAITGRIQNAINKAVATAKANFGWQMITYPIGTAFYLNVPIAESSVIYQYVMNPLTGAWTRYTGMNMPCWELLDDTLYSGGLGGKVFLSDDGNQDNGSNIVYDLKTAFNYFGVRGINKSYRMARANFFGDGRVIPTMAFNTDFATTPEPTQVAAAIQNAGSLWNNFNWNDGTLWATGQLNFGDWIGVDGQGHCAAIRMKVAPTKQDSTQPIDLRLNSFDILWERGAFL